MHDESKSTAGPALATVIRLAQQMGHVSTKMLSMPRGSMCPAEPLSHWPQIVPGASPAEPAHEQHQ
jgi:hypothetical protein